jgi:hypothetical protein
LLFFEVIYLSAYVQKSSFEESDNLPSTVIYQQKLVKTETFSQTRIKEPTITEEIWQTPIIAALN